MLLIDTSVWVELLRSGAGVHEVRAAAKRLPDTVTCGPVLQEVLQGLDDSRDSTALREALLNLPRLEDPLPLDLFLNAAHIYRAGRRRGYTIRSTVDCLIAAIAIRHDAVIWHNRDRDYSFIAQYTDLRTIT
jgi:predicted nucleic acid-binding protein